jgi:hypothetical protein
MAGVINTTYAFTGTDVITSDKMNNIVDESFFTGDAVISNCPLTVSSNKLTVKAGGITANEMGTDSVTAVAIAAGSVTPAKLQSAGAYTIGTLTCAAVTSVGNMSVTGTITASGNITAFSDLALKKNVETISNALEMVSRLRGVRFVFAESCQSSIGVIAQELQQVAPELVETSGDYLSVAYGNISGILIEAIKELSAKVERLENVTTN